MHVLYMLPLNAITTNRVYTCSIPNGELIFKLCAAKMGI